jgi:hypothetical protein
MPPGSELGFSGLLVSNREEASDVPLHFRNQCGVNRVTRPATTVALLSALWPTRALEQTLAPDCCAGFGRKQVLADVALRDTLFA